MKRSLLFSAVLCAASLTSVHAAQPITEPEFASDIVDRYADHIFYGSGATGMALVVIDGNQRVFRSYGETRPGNNVRPQLDSVVRIASLTKLMTSEMLVKLLDQGTVKLNDPLSKYAPPGARVPTYNGTPITLVNLATHTSALPREQPGGAAHRPVFVWPTREQRWKYLSTAKLKAAPGSQAAYSNLAFDLLADALANASGKPYTQLFEEQITRPLGMKDTTYTPSPDQCRRLMVAERGASPCNNTLAAIGSGGVYSTPGDMMRWMQQYLSSDFYQRSNQAESHADVDLSARAVYESDWHGCPRQSGCAWFRLGIYGPERGSSGDYSEDRRWWRFHYLYGDDPAEEYWRVCGCHSFAVDAL